MKHLLFSWIKSHKSAILLLGFLCSYSLTFIPNSNETAYLIPAKFWKNSLESWYLTDAIWTSYIWYYIFGFLDSQLGIYILTFSARIAIILCWLKLFLNIQRLCEFNYQEIVFLLIVFIWRDQNFVGGAWMIGTFEPKGIAWILVCYGLYSLYVNKIFQGFFWLALSVAFHVLVGGYMFLLATGYLLFTRRHVVPVLLFGSFSLIYLGFLLFKMSSSEYPDAIHDSALDWMVHTRNPHHLAIFSHVKNHSLGIALTILSPLVLLKGRFRLSRLFLPTMYLWCFQILLMIAAYFLRDTAFALYYPLRVNTLFLLVILIGIFYNYRIQIPRFYFGIFICIALTKFALTNARKTYYSYVDYLELTDLFEDLDCDHAYLYDNSSSAKWGNSIVPYFSKIDPYFYWKLTPIDDSLIVEAASRMGKIEDYSISELVANELTIGSVLSRDSIELEGFRILQSNDSFLLYGRIEQLASTHIDPTSERDVFDLSLIDTAHVDLNGNGVDEKVFLDFGDCTSLVIREEGAEEIRIGCGVELGHEIPNDIGWLDEWSLEAPGLKWESFLDEEDMLDERQVSIPFWGVYVGKQEASGGILCYIDGELVYLHQGC